MFATRTLSLHSACLYTAAILHCFAAHSNAEITVTDEQLIELFSDLRVTDVCDGMDALGLFDTGLMGPEIGPLWKDIDEFQHRVVGIALTARYVPSNRPPTPGEASVDEYKKFRDLWYTHLSGEPFSDAIKPGHVLVIDNTGDGDTGTIGSKNSLLWVSKGAVGVVAAGGVRDVDEIAKQRIPVYTDDRKRGRGIRPGRNELESFNKPVVVGGALVNPGDVIIADGDGVVVVPRERAVAVANFANEENGIDHAERRELYKKLGIPLDDTVE